MVSVSVGTDKYVNGRSGANYASQVLDDPRFILIGYIAVADNVSGGGLYQNHIAKSYIDEVNFHWSSSSLDKDSKRVISLTLLTGLLAHISHLHYASSTKILLLRLNTKSRRPLWTRG